MAHTDRSSLLATMAWSLAVLLAMGILFGLLIGPALTEKRHALVGQGYLPPAAPTDQTDFAAVKGRQAPGINLSLAVAGDPALRGWALEEYGKICSACHGPGGKGDSPAGLALQARDFTVAADWKNGPKLSQVFGTLSTGLAPKMPSYDTYSPAQRMALAHVVQGFYTFPVPRDTPVEIAAMDATWSLSAGVRDPGRVPVRIAMERLVAEGRSATLNLEALPADLRHLVNDARRAGQTLAGLRGGLTDPAGAATGLVTGAPANGFSPGIATLNGAEWQRLGMSLAAAMSESTRATSSN